MNSKAFIDQLLASGLTFFSGIPDSALKNFVKEVDILKSEAEGSVKKTARVVYVAHEGLAVARAIGNYLATGKPGVIFLQNAGLGVTINPLVSLLSKEVFNIPVLLIIGWRGKPGQLDEPQHNLQGQITLPLLELCQISHFIVNKESTLDQIKYEIENSIFAKVPKSLALVVEPGIL